MSGASGIQQNGGPFGSFFRRWKDWRGTSSRSEYWAGFFWSTLIGSVVGFILMADPYGTLNNLLFITTFPTLLWLSLAMNIRRARDAGLHPASILLLLIPVVGLVGLILLGTLPSDKR